MEEMNMELQVIDSCYWVWADERDYIFWEDMSAIELAPKLDDTKYFYNQATLLWGKLRAFCTVMSPIHVLSSIFNYELTTEDWQDLWNYAQEKYWYREWVGNYVKIWVACACSRWNSKFKDKWREVVYFQIPELMSHDCWMAMSKWYAVCSWYGWDYLFNRDRDDDWVINWTEFKRVYGHAVPVWDENVKRNTDIIYQHFGAFWDTVYDSYKWRKTNVFKLNNLQWLRNSWTFYPTAYIIVPDPQSTIRKEIEQKRLAINEKMNSNMGANSEMWHLIDQHPTATDRQKQELKDSLHRTNNAYRDILK